MRQIIQQQDEKIEEEDNVKVRQKWLGEIGAVSLNVQTEGSMKHKKKRLSALQNNFSGSTTSIAADSPDDEEV